MSELSYQTKFVAIIAFCYLNTCLYIYMTKDMLKNQISIIVPMQDPGALQVNKTNKMLSILVYNPPRKKQFLTMKDDFATCPYTNYILTANRSELRRHAAILYHLTNVPILPTQPPISSGNRRSDQVWIFLWLESPVYHFTKERRVYMNKHWRNTVNWTMTYTYDADIFTPYGKIIKRDTLPNRNYSQMFYSKTRMAAWIVSNCHTKSRREVYIKQMKKHGVQVDIFGGCSGQRKDYNYLINEINKEYKFYLSFENSFCKDYITEKFYKRIELDTILVVRGGGNYSKAIESGAYINTADFKSVKELAKFMVSVASNVTLFTQFMENKSKYTVTDRSDIRRNSFCDICSKLNNLDQNRRTYTNAVDNIHNNSCYIPHDLQ